MTALVIFAVLAAFGVFGSLCTLAPEWDDDAQAPVRAEVPAAERA